MTNVFMRVVSSSPSSLVENILCKANVDYESDVREMMMSLEDGATREQAERIVLLGYLRRLKDSWKIKT